MERRRDCKARASAHDKRTSFCVVLFGETFAMLASRWTLSRGLVFATEGTTKSNGAANAGLSRASTRRYSTVRRRVVKSDSDLASKIYATEDPAAVEKRRQELDREFDETFFRKPKVLIIGTDVTAMTTGTHPISMFCY